MGFKEMGYALPAIQNTVSTIGNIQQMDMMRKKFEQEQTLNAPQIRMAKMREQIAGRKIKINSIEDYGQLSDILPGITEGMARDPTFFQKFHKTAQNYGIFDADGTTTVGQLQGLFEAGMANKEMAYEWAIKDQLGQAKKGFATAMQEQQEAIDKYGPGSPQAQKAAQKAVLFSKTINGINGKWESAVQYFQNPYTGEITGVDKSTGQGFNVPIGGTGGMGSGVTGGFQPGAGGGGYQTGSVPREIDDGFTTASRAIPEEINGYLTAAANQFGVDPQLVKAVAGTESLWAKDPVRATSTKGAKGLMQVMPETYAAIKKELSEQYGMTLSDDPYDPSSNAFAGAYYLRKMLDEFGGNVEMALAAYNAGPEAVKKYGGIPPYAETQKYVPQIMASMRGDTVTPARGAGPEYPQTATDAGGVDPIISKNQRIIDESQALIERISATPPTSKAQEISQSKKIAALQSRITNAQKEIDRQDKRATDYNKENQLSGDAKNLEIILGRKPTVEELREYKKAASTTINVGDKRESKFMEEFTGKVLPKLHEEAMADKDAIGRFDMTIDLLKKSGDDITGVSGAIKRFAAPYATALGINTDKMTDAQILNVLFSAQAGSLRKEIVGPGQVSNFEQQILQGVSGGSISTATGAMALMEYYRNQKVKRIGDVNERIKAAAAIPGYENLPGIYPPIEIGAGKNDSPATADDYLKSIGVQ